MGKQILIQIAINISNGKFEQAIDPDVTKWVRCSAAGFVLVTTLFVSWVIVFQTSWKEKRWENLLLQISIENLERDW
jgi:hypothetical protein